MKPSLIPLVVVALSVPAFAQLNDAPPLDMKQVLQGLRQFKEQNAATQTALRNGAYKQIVAAAGSNESAAAFWTSAVMAVQIAGKDHESAAARGWTKGDGEGFKSREAMNAARLHLMWLGLTLQHISDAETKQLLPSVIDFTRQLEADEVAASAFLEKLEKKVERIPGVKKPRDWNSPRELQNLQDQLNGLASRKPPTPGSKDALEDVRGKMLHDNIMKAAVGSSPVAEKLQIVEMLGEAGAKKKKKGDAGDAAAWEPVPRNVDGIYNAIILPEFRDTKDPRLMDYWEMMLRKNQASLYAGMPTFEEKQRTQIERPSMMWDRTQDMLLLGLRNRAVTDMFNLIKGYPQHPDAAGWITQLEKLVAPAPTPVATVQSSGSVAPPAPVPPATAPGTPPTAVIIPAAPPGVR